MAQKMIYKIKMKSTETEVSCFWLLLRASVLTPAKPAVGGVEFVVTRDVSFSCPPASTRQSIPLFVVLSQTGSFDGKSLLQVGRVDSLESEGESSLNRVNSVSFRSITLQTAVFYYYWTTVSTEYFCCSYTCTCMYREHVQSWLSVCSSTY